MKTNSYPSPWDLIYFQEIAKVQNLSRAAERLGVAQPTLSLSIKRLEDLMKSKLFLRRNKGLLLTATGESLLKECDHLLQAWDRVVSDATKSKNEIRGRFTLGCHAAVALYSLDPLLADLYKEHSQIEINLVHNLSRVICEQIISGKIDMGIVVNPIKHPDLVLHRLAVDEVAVWRTGKSMLDTIIYNPEMMQSQSILRKFKKTQFNRSITSESLDVIAILVRSGAGVGILPTRVVQAVTPELKKMTDFPVFHDEIYFVYRSDIVKTAAVKVILEKIKGLRV